jgi:hypothetical protein
VVPRDPLGTLENLRAPNDPVRSLLFHGVFPGPQFTRGFRCVLEVLSDSGYIGVHLVPHHFGMGPTNAKFLAILLYLCMCLTPKGLLFLYPDPTVWMRTNRHSEFEKCGSHRFNQLLLNRGWESEWSTQVGTGMAGEGSHAYRALA